MGQIGDKVFREGIHALKLSDGQGFQIRDVLENLTGIARRSSSAVRDSLSNLRELERGCHFGRNWDSPTELSLLSTGGGTTAWRCIRRHDRIFGVLEDCKPDEFSDSCGPRAGFLSTALLVF